MARYVGPSWDTLINSHSNKWKVEVETQVEFNNIYISLKNCLEKKIATFRHAAYLEPYLLDDLIPFGLRLKTFFPTSGNPHLILKEIGKKL